MANERDSADSPEVPTLSGAGNLNAAPDGIDSAPKSPLSEGISAPKSAAATDKSAEKARRQFLTGRAARALEGTPIGLTPWQLAWRQLRKNRWAMAGGCVLIVFYICALFAPFIAPYDPTEDNPNGAGSHPGQAPMKLRWREANGAWHKRPFVYQTVQSFDENRNFVYLPDPNQPQVLRWFIKGSPYKLFGLIPMQRHLFGVNKGQIFLLGTDQVGRDFLSRLLCGAQISLSIGLVAITISFILGMLVGGISGFYGGRVDSVIMRGCEVLMSVPQFYLLLALAAILPPEWGPAKKYILITVILSFVGWAGMARIIRGMVLSVREREYVEAARALGVSDFKLVTRHILPSTFTYAIVAATMSIPGYILGEASLSFLDLGIRDPVPSWGNMLIEAQQSILQNRPWILIPGLLIFLTTLSFNFLGDGLRDALDPKSRK
jgi:peptide/nickel transport system permease protein